MSVAFWMLDSNASGMRTIGAAPTFGTRRDHATDFVPRHRAVLHLEPDEVEMLADLAVQLGIEARDRVAGDLSIVEQRFFRAVVEWPRGGGIHQGFHLPAPAALVGFLRRQRAADWRAPGVGPPRRRRASLAAGAGGSCEADRSTRRWPSRSRSKSGSRHRTSLEVCAHYGAFVLALRSISIPLNRCTSPLHRPRRSCGIRVALRANDKSVWTGVYTTAQATRGTDLYIASAASAMATTSKAARRRPRSPADRSRSGGTARR